MAPSEWYHTKTKRKFNTWRYIDETKDVIELRLADEHRCFFDANFKHMLLQHQWRAWKSRNTWYARGKYYNRGEERHLLMHRMILGVTDASVVVDHKDGNGLNNAIANIRTCTPTENNNNRKLSSNNTSGENGIFLRTDRPSWRVIWYEGDKQKRAAFDFDGGSGHTKEEAFEAAKAYRDEVYARIGNKNGIRPK